MTHNYLLFYSPIQLPYRSPIDQRKPTICAADHKQSALMDIYYGLAIDWMGSCRPVFTISSRETNMALLTFLSAALTAS